MTAREKHEEVELSVREAHRRRAHAGFVRVDVEDQRAELHSLGLRKLARTPLDRAQARHQLVRVVRDQNEVIVAPARVDPRELRPLDPEQQRNLRSRGANPPHDERAQLSVAARFDEHGVAALDDVRRRAHRHALAHCAAEVDERRCGERFAKRRDDGHSHEVLREPTTDFSDCEPLCARSLCDGLTRARPQ